MICDNCFRTCRGSPLDHEGPCEREGCHPEWLRIEDTEGQLAVVRRELHFCSTACSMAHGQWEKLWCGPGEGERSPVLIPAGSYDRLEIELGEAGSGRHLVAFVPQALCAQELAQCAAELQGVALHLESIRVKEQSEPMDLPPPRSPRWFERVDVQATLRILGIKGILTALTVPLVMGADPVVTWGIALAAQTWFEVVAVAAMRVVFKQRLSVTAHDEDDDDDDEDDAGSAGGGMSGAHRGG